MGIISWIIVGALAGWIASLIMGTNNQQGCLLDIVVGIVGAFIGGFVMSLLGFGTFNGFNLWSIIVAIIGAVILLAIIKAVRGRT
ncbi:GlsB/YeaQ/YmgE family stress response membrane protein [soil metagenome]